MGHIVPPEDPYDPLTADCSFDQGPVHWVGTAGASFHDGNAYLEVIDYVAIGPLINPVVVTVAGVYRIAINVIQLNHTEWQIRFGAYWSPKTELAGWVYYYTILAIGNHIHTIQAWATAGVCDMVIGSMCVSLNTSGDLQAYQASVSENLVPPTRSKYEYWPRDPVDTILLANIKQPSNILIQRELY